MRHEDWISRYVEFYQRLRPKKFTTRFVDHLWRMTDVKPHEPIRYAMLSADHVIPERTKAMSDEFPDRHRYGVFIRGRKGWRRWSSYNYKEVIKR